MSQRRSTIHDAAALRLHPSGVRVNDDVQRAMRTVLTVKNKAPGLSRRLPRGHWIATDAGGDGKVTKRRKLRGGVSNDVETTNASTVDDGEVDSGVPGTQGEFEEAPVKVYKDKRANRRVAFENDLTFLAAPTSVPKGDISQLPPSSDFLKCIHHFASQYYGSRGQLLDSAGDYRKVKKENRKQRMLQAAASESQDPDNGQDERGNERGEEETESDDSEIAASKSTRRQKGKGKAKSGTITKTQTDMYKAFDGSALLCIGTLLQSHIAASLVDHMPLEDDNLSLGSEEYLERPDSESAETQLEQENGP